MAEFKLVIGDSKTGKSYQKVVSDDSLIGKKIGDKVDGKLAGLDGYELEIRGGSDDAGFPMRDDIPGSSRKSPLLSGGTGVKKGFKKGREKGLRIRKTVMGNTIGEKIVQINLKIVKHGSKPVDDLLGVKEAPAEGAAEAPKEAPKEEPKKEAPKEEKKEAPKEEVKKVEELKEEKKEASEKKEEGNEKV